MTSLTGDDIKQHVLVVLAPYFRRAEIDEKEINDTEDLYELGVFDSLELVNIYAALEKDMGLVAEFEELDDTIPFTSLLGMVTALKKSS